MVKILGREVALAELAFPLSSPPVTFKYIFPPSSAIRYPTIVNAEKQKIS